VKRLGAKIGSAILLANALLVGMRQASASPPVHKFLECYRAVEESDAQMNFWERVACSLLLSRLDPAPGNPTISPPS
jgi:hypothetical protein